MFRTAWRTVCAHRARLVMTVLAVMAGVAFVTGTLVFTATVSDSLTASWRQDVAGIDVLVRPGDGQEPAGTARPALSPDAVRRLAHLPQAAALTPIAAGHTAVACRDGRQAGLGGEARGANYAPPVRTGRTAAVDPRYTFVAGRPPARTGEIALDERSAERCGYHEGDRARISVDGPGHTVLVSGVFTTRSEPALTAGGSLVLFDTRTAQRYFTGADRFTEVRLTAARGVSADRLQQAADAAEPATETTTGAVLAEDRAQSAEATVTGLRSTLLSFAAVTLFVSCFLIANTFRMLVAQRTREVALLRAVGASRRQVTRRVLVEALLVGLMASACGVVAGLGVAHVLRPFADSLGKSGPLPTDGPLSLPAYALLVPLATGVATTVAASWLPARRAARIAPLAALRATQAPAPAPTPLLRAVLGALLTAAGVGAVLGAAGMDDAANGAPLMAAGAVGAALGVVALMPLLVRPALALAGPALAARGAAGRLAAGNLARGPRHTAAAAASLTIGLALLTALTVVAGGSLAAANAQGAQVLAADYAVTMDDLSPLSGDVARRLAASPAVASADAVRTARMDLDGEEESVSTLAPRAAREFLRLRFTSGSARDFGGTRVLVSDDAAKANGWSAGSRLAGRLPDGSRRRLTVAGVYTSTTLLTGLVADPATVPAPTGAADMVLVAAHDRPGPAVRAALAHALGDSPAVRIDSSADLAHRAAHEAEGLLRLLYALLAVSLLVALLGIVNTLALSVAERRREIGMLRAIGLTRAGVRTMVRWEAVLIALFGGVLGIGLGVFLGWEGSGLLSAGIPGFHQGVPVVSLALLLFPAVATGVAASLWPADRAARTSALTAVGAE